MLIKIPDNFLPERKYIIEIIFSEFLGINFNFEYTKYPYYEMILENGSILKIKDYFFSKFNENNSYLSVDNIPQKIIFAKNQFIPENDIPVIYGNDNLILNENNIICDIDIFASSFFMLTRWEEYVNKKRDSHNRFPAAESTSYKFNFLDRPVVNEYVEMLWNMLKFLKFNKERKKINFNLILTHDVDQPLWSQRNIFKRVGKDLLTKKNPKKIIQSIDIHIKSKINKTFDPYNNYNYLMALSEKNNVKSHFFFSAAQKSKFDAGYNINSNKIRNIISNIKHRGHIIGIHPGYFSYNNAQIWKKEFVNINKILDYNISCSRQHYLRFEIPVTWQICEDNLIKWDSTLSYTEKEGFRCGICYEFSVFNILTKKKLSLKEKPLIVMEGSFFQYQSISQNEIIEKTICLKNKVKKYCGNFVLLWHNSSFNVEGYENNKYIYEEILK